MSLGKNIQFLRKQKKITQEQLAEEMSVSRQTVSKWEADEIVPELDKIIVLSDMFSCKLDDLVRENLMSGDEVYSEVTIKNVKGFRMARYVMITPNPEDDVSRYMDEWATRSGLLAINPNAKKLDGIFHGFPLNYRIGLDCMGMYPPMFFRMVLRQTALV